MELLLRRGATIAFALSLVPFAAVGQVGAPVARAASETALPAVETFFKRPKYADVTLSPDGKLLAALVPTNERRNLAVIDVQNSSIKLLTTLKDEDVAQYQWVGDRLLEVSTANLTDESGLIQLKQRVLVDTEGRVVRDMFRAALRDNRMRDTVYVNVAAHMEILETLNREGDDLVVESNERNRYSLDAFRFNPRTGQKTLLTFESPGEVRQLVSDHKGQVRIAVVVPKGEERTSLWYRKSNDDRWVRLVESAYEDEDIRPLAFDYDDQTLYVAARSDREGRRFGVYKFDPEKNRLGDLVFENPLGDTQRVIFDRTKRILAGVPDNSLPGVHWIDPEWASVQKAVDAALPGMRNRLAWARYAPERVIVTSDSGSKAPRFYMLDRRTNKLEELVESRPWLDELKLGKRQLVRYKARDGMTIPAHLTLPVDREEKALPLVVVIHGGPYVRGGRFGFEEEAHFFASRGYAVLEPDFRGTKGYGDAFYKAGWRQWGLAMQDDVTDGVKWLVSSGRVDADRVCLFGASYGGYATLWGLAKEPQMFRCGVAFVAVSDLELMFDVGWSDFMSGERGGDTTRTLARWIGDPDRDREKMRAVSPVYHADRIQAPLLLAYGAADTRVPLVHGDRMRAALDRNKKTYEWVVYNDEWHGFNKDENKFDFYRRVDAFLAKNLAPRAAPVKAAAAQ